MKMLLDVRAVLDVPDGSPGLVAMTLQDSPAVLFAMLEQSGYEVIVHIAPLASEAEG